jgi:uncharacterized integral membrane protein
MALCKYSKRRKIVVVVIIIIIIIVMIIIINSSLSKLRYSYLVTNFVYIPLCII